MERDGDERVCLNCLDVDYQSFSLWIRLVDWWFFMICNMTATSYEYSNRFFPIKISWLLQINFPSPHYSSRSKYLYELFSIDVAKWFLFYSNITVVIIVEYNACTVHNCTYLYCMKMGSCYILRLLKNTHSVRASNLI